MANKQTAVEWLYDRFIFAGYAAPSEWKEQAKEIEIEQIISAHNDGALMAYALPFNAPFKKGEEYYNETYGKI